GQSHRALAGRVGGGRGPHHAGLLRGLQRLSGLPGLAHRRAGLDPRHRAPRDDVHGADRGGPRRASPGGRPGARGGRARAIVRRGMTSMERIAEVLDGLPGVPDRSTEGSGTTARPVLRGPGAIEFRHLTFAYPGREPTLRDVSFTVPSGVM